MDARVPAEAWRALVETSADAMLVGRLADGHVLYANPAACRMWGRASSELVDRPRNALHPPLAHAPLDRLTQKATASGHGRLSRVDILLPSGETRPVEYSLVCIADATEPVYVATLRLLDLPTDNVAESSLPGALMRLAGGVAHQVNNPATILLANLEYLGDELAHAPASPVQAESWLGMLEDCRAAVLRICRMADALKVFARSDPDLGGSVRLDHLTREAVRRVGAELGADTEIVAFVDTVPPICGDPEQLLRAIVEVMINAADAAGDAGSIQVSVSRGEGLQRIVVRDSGPGLSEELQQLAFEPFFTTKRGGAGVGLGLASARRAVEQHGGTLGVESTPGHGATFVFQLPEVVPLGTEDFAEPVKVLVVSHDADVRRDIALALAPSIAVEQAAGPAEASRRLAEGTPELVVLDLHIPRGGSQAFYWELTPHLRDRVVFVVAGSLAEPELQRLADAAGWLEKPLRAEKVRGEVARRLGWVSQT